MSKYKSFIFEDYKFDPASKEVSLYYSLDGQLKFKEVIKWNVDSDRCNEEILDRALYSLWIMAGISYYKTYLPKEIIINKGSLSKQQKDFFDKLYTLGLAQFFYTNRLEWKNRVNFPCSKKSENKKLNLQRNEGSGYLVSMGGGKDSIVAAEIMKKLNVPFDCWSTNQSDRFMPITKKMEVNSIKVERRIDPLLLKLNKDGAYNGHVPITAILGFIGVVLAILAKRKGLVWAIESSTDESNLDWEGLKVNHQYSKTSENEKDMAEYINEFIATDIEFFSILRPFSELRIAEIFCKNYLDKYKDDFSSCNANFMIGKTDRLIWCGKCPKCAFVFTIFSPFIEKSRLIDMFSSRNIFADEDMEGTIKELLGTDGHKPLECVGEIAETRTAIRMAKQTGQYPELERLDFPYQDYDYKKLGKNNIPNEIASELISLSYKL